MSKLIPHLRGWALVAAFIFMVVYTLWFVGPGYFGQLGALSPDLPLQSAFFYSGEHAVTTLGDIDPEDRKIAYLAYLFDLPFMWISTVVFTSFIALGIKALNLKNWFGKLALLMPALFLFFDISEDSLLAITLASGSEVTGAVAGFATLLKMIAFGVSNLAAIAFGLAALVIKIMRKT